MSNTSRSFTKKGPGRRHFNRTPNPVGTKLIKRFIKDASGESLEYRKILQVIQPNHRLVGGRHGLG